MKKQNQKNIILISKSPRRKELLKDLGFEFNSIETKVSEKFPKDLEKWKITEYLAEKKAQSITDVSNDDIVISADTIVWFEGKVLEKPKDTDEALAMLSQLSNETHQVYTTVGFKTKDGYYSVSDSTDVLMDTISEEEALDYVKKFKPMDKAGAYGIQDWLGMAKVVSLRGSFYNVMGFPTHLVYPMLLKLGASPTFSKK